MQLFQFLLLGDLIKNCDDAFVLFSGFPKQIVLMDANRELFHTLLRFKNAIICVKTLYEQPSDNLLSSEVNLNSRIELDYLINDLEEFCVIAV